MNSLFIVYDFLKITNITIAFNYCSYLYVLLICLLYILNSVEDNGF